MNEILSEAKLHSSLYAEHLSLGAKIVDFHGWLMPLYYQGIIEEVKTVREKAGLFDLSHMGEIIVEGEEASDFLEFVTPNAVSALKDGQMQYSFFLSSEGEVLDDFMLYRLADRFMAVVNAGNTPRIFKHLQSQKFKKVKLSNQTESLSLIGLQGPGAEKIFKKIVKENLDNFKFLNIREFSLAGEKLLVSRSGYTGEDGFEIYVDEKSALKVWRMIMDRGREFGLKPAGLGARDILRLEMGYPLYGQEWVERVTPWEAGFSWVIKLNKDFLGKGALVKRKDKAFHRLIAFVMKEKAVARANYPIKKNGEHIGWVTSGTFSPTLAEFIGMGYIDKDFAKIGEEIFIEIRKKVFPAEIVKLPFVKTRVKY